MNRRHFIAALAGTPALIALATACGDPNPRTISDPGPVGTQPAGPPTSSGNGTGTVTGPATADIAHATGPADVILRLGYEGGFVRPSTTFVRVPTLLITGAGQVIQPGAQIEIFPGPLLPAITTRSITEAGIQQILALASTSGLLATPPDYSAETNVADVPDTVLDITTASGSFHHDAYALGMAGPPATDGSATPEVTPARQRFAAFVAAVGDLDSLLGDAVGPATPLVPTAYRLQATPTTLDAFAGADPQPTVQPWPATIGVRLAAAATCAIVSGAEVVAVLEAANTQSLFTDAGVTYELAAVAQLPGDATC